MGSRRIGRKRLYALNKAGEKLTSTAGVAMEGNIGSQTRLRDGEIIATDITIDLGSSNGAAHSFSVTGLAGATSTITAIGVSSSSGTHGNAQIMQINKNASEADSIGVFTGGELMCVETPTGGNTVIGVYVGNAVTASSDNMTLNATQVIAPTAMVIGKNKAIDPDTDLDNKYIYLVSSGSTDADYTAGKFVITLEGYIAPDDI